MRSVRMSDNVDNCKCTDGLIKAVGVVLSVLLTFDCVNTKRCSCVLER